MLSQENKTKITKTKAIHHGVDGRRKKTTITLVFVRVLAFDVCVVRSQQRHDNENDNNSGNDVDGIDKNEIKTATTYQPTLNYDPPTVILESSVVVVVVVVVIAAVLVSRFVVVDVFVVSHVAARRDKVKKVDTVGKLM